MYSRYHGRQDGSVELPRDYGGNAFSTERVSPEPMGGGRIEVARPTVAEPEPIVEPSPPSLPVIEETSEREIPPPRPLPHPSLTAGLLPMGKGFPFAHGIGFEELLILGLILLLSQSEVGSETLLWLCLLLFCG